MRDAAAFVASFADFWSRPSPDRMPELLSAEIRLVQPLAKPMVGLPAARDGFARIFAAIPDLRGEVDRWSAAGDHLFIEFRLIGTVARRTFTWPAVDRFTLRDGYAIERVSYFDPLPLIAAGLKHPTGWWQLWKAGPAG